MPIVTTLREATCVRVRVDTSAMEHGVERKAMHQVFVLLHSR